MELGKPQKDSWIIEMSDEVTYESPSVHSYLGILQDTITRMAANSSNCKAWCITLVSAIAVLVADKGKPEFVWIATVPIVLFVLLDAYYLSLERAFRTQYNEFIKKLHYQSASVNDVFIIKAKDHNLRSTLECVGSFSICPFYGLLAGMLVIVRYFVI